MRGTGYTLTRSEKRATSVGWVLRPRLKRVRFDFTRFGMIWFDRVLSSAPYEDRWANFRILIMSD